MNANLRFNLQQVYTKETPNEIRKKHLYQKIPTPKYFSKTPQAINLWVSICGQNFRVSTQHKILPEYWNFHSHDVKRTYEHHMSLNLILNRLKSNVENEIMMAQVRNPTICYEEIISLVKSVIKNNKPKPKSSDFFAVYDEFFEAKKPHIKPKTQNKYEILRMILMDFKKAKRYDLTFPNINKKFLDDFTLYLSQTRKQLVSTSSKYVKNLFVFLNYAVEKEYTDNVKYKSYKVKKYEKEVIFLFEDELEKLIKMDLEASPRLQRVKDLFVFLCYTGQRFEDGLQLKNSALSHKDGNWVWNLWQIKQDKPEKVTVPIIGEAQRIVEKYYDEKNVRLFPKIANQTANRYIKEICQIAEINENIHEVKYQGAKRLELDTPKYQLISMHAARRTFVCLSLQRGMSREVIMEITGHKNFSSFKKYRKVMNKWIRDDYKKGWGK